MSISTVTAESPVKQDDTRHRVFYTLLGFGLIVVFPTVFWLGVAELVSSVLGLPYGAVGRAIIAMLLLTISTFVWALINSANRYAEADANF